MSKIMNTYKAKTVMEGAGVPVNRVFGYNETHDFDPFLMLDYFYADKNTKSPGFPWHPHRGIETITYFLRGSGMHEDSMGNKGTISAGELQWMSAGKGIYHQEMPVPGDDGLEGFQFWLNLPKGKKLKEPDYQYIKQGEMKTVVQDGAHIRVISGSYDDIKGVINKDDLAVTMLHITLDANSNISLQRDKDKQGFIFLFDGSGKIDNQSAEKLTAYTLSDGQINIESHEKMDFIFAQGKPLQEPIAWRGPIVMNTQEEIFTAFKELQDGTFTD